MFNEIVERLRKEESIESIRESFEKRFQDCCEKAQKQVDKDSAKQKLLNKIIVDIEEYLKLTNPKLSRQIDIKDLSIFLDKGLEFALTF